MNLVTLIIGGLAVWRVSHMLVKEAGPLMIFPRFRAFLARTQKRSGGSYDLLSCVYCTSVWTGLVAALCVSGDVFHKLAYALAFSAIATIVEVLLYDRHNPTTITRTINRSSIPEGYITTD